jgi:cytochrome c oxidase subunit 2
MMRKYLGLPELASQQGGAIDNLLGLVHILMLILFVGWLTYFIYVLLRFRRRKHPAADHHGLRSHFSNYLEGGVALAEGLLLVGFAIPIWAHSVLKFPDAKDATVVYVTAQQFAWNARYAGPDGVFGKQELKYVSPENPMGIDPTDPAGKDDITTLNQIYVPVDKPVLIHLSSLDVIHCLSIKPMRVAQDAIPGMSMPVWFTPVKTGQFEINCAQLCGNSHFRMRGYLNVVTAKEYQEWLAQKSKSGAKSESYE